MFTSSILSVIGKWRNCHYYYYILEIESTECQLAVEKALQTPASSDPFVPRCKEDGKFEEVQCSEFTGECWCVDKNGKEKPETRTAEMPQCQLKGMLRLIFFFKFTFFIYM